MLCTADAKSTSVTWWVTRYRHSNLNIVGLAYPIQCQRDDMMTPEYIFDITATFH